MFQLKLFRIISLLTIAGGLLSIYSGLIRIKNWKIYYFYPLLLFALLAQDMFFSVNIDAFSFLFGSLILNRMMTLFQNPESIRLWTGLSVAVSLGLWAKFTNAYFFLLWPLLTFFLWREERTGQLLKRSLFFFVLTLIISSPWYILNQFRFGTPFATNLGEASSLWPVYPHGPVSFESFFLFLRAFTRTFFRGELLWNGESFDVYQGITRELLLTIIPLILAAAGLIFSLKLFKSTQLREHQFFISSSFLIGGVLLLGYFFVGHVPLYHARYVMGGFYVLLFSMVYGGVRMFRSERAAFFGLGAYLFVQNILYASLLLGKVI
jgi:4-amino-4-deoxy-L-arabinose transferase-like glycosyltransferase